jgi:hypothetical protein
MQLIRPTAIQKPNITVKQFQETLVKQIAIQLESKTFELNSKRVEYVEATSSERRFDIEETSVW